MRRRALRLCFVGHEIVDDDDVLGLQLGRQRMAQAQCAIFFGRSCAWLADDRPVSLAAAAELRSTSRMVAGAARTLLLVHLGAPVRETSARPLDFVRALLAALRAASERRGPMMSSRGLETENGVGKGNLSRSLALEGFDGEYPLFGSLTSILRARTAAGRGAPSGVPDLMASRTTIQEPLEPELHP